MRSRRAAGTLARGRLLQANRDVRSFGVWGSSDRPEVSRFTLSERLSARFDRVVLLLQGGGALGAYQAGVYEALAEANLHPDWVAGISIGAVNATIVAGNPPNLRVQKLAKHI
jgi:predicted acylesterase/phospholipase RssA